MTTIWERYFLRQALSSFAFFIAGFYGLFVLIDYASHASSYRHNHIHFQWIEVARYYTWEFIERMDVLIPFALLIATIRTLCYLNNYNELVALRVSGVKLKTLMRPFVLIGLFFTGLIYANNEYLLPIALKEIKHIDETHKSQKNKSNLLPSVQHVMLADNSTLIFQSYDSYDEHFFDTYWIPSINSIYRIKYLYPYSEVPRGLFVDHLVRRPSGELVIDQSFEEKAFPEMKFNKKALMETITYPEERSLSELWGKLSRLENIQSEKESQVAANFYYKLAIPWLCLLAVIAPAPFCVRFSRTLPTFFIYACSIFGLVAFYLVMDASLILGERQVFPAQYAIWVPFLGLASILGWRFLRLA